MTARTSDLPLRFRLVGDLPASASVGQYSYLVHLDDAGTRSSSYLVASGIDSWVLASNLSGDLGRAVERLREGFSAPSGRGAEICAALLTQRILEVVP